MSVEVAKSAGFCFGAKRAVDMVYELLHRGEKAATLGRCCTIRSWWRSWKLKA